MWFWCCIYFLAITGEWRCCVGSDLICWDFQRDFAIGLWSNGFCIYFLAITREWRCCVGSDPVCWDFQRDFAFGLWPMASPIVLFHCNWVKNGIDNKSNPTINKMMLGFYLQIRHILHEFNKPFVFLAQV